MKSFLMMWLAFGGSMGAYFTIQYGPRIGIPCGVGSGLLFAVLMSAFGKYQARNFKGQCPLAHGESLVKEGPANHFVRAEGVGGWLYLTTKRLYFRSHAFNNQNHELVIPLRDITNARRSWTAGIIPNGLTVETAKGRERFVVNGARSWVEAIEWTKPAMTNPAKANQPPEDS